MFSVRTDLILAMIIIGMIFLAVAWVALVIFALDGMDGKTDSNATFHMIWIMALFGFVEYAMLNALPPKAVV